MRATRAQKRDALSRTTEPNTAAKAPACHGLLMVPATSVLPLYSLLERSFWKSRRVKTESAPGAPQHIVADGHEARFSHFADRVARPPPGGRGEGHGRLAPGTGRRSTCAKWQPLRPAKFTVWGPCFSKRERAPSSAITNFVLVAARLRHPSRRFACDAWLASACGRSTGKRDRRGGCRRTRSARR